MENLINLFIKSIFIENMVFAYFLGMCSYLAVSKSVKTATGLGLAVIFVLGITLPVNYLLENYILAEGAMSWLGPAFVSVDLSFLSFIMFIAVIASMVQLVEMVVEKFAPVLYTQLGIFLPLIAVNCAILGGALFMQQKAFHNIGEATVYGLGSGLGWFPGYCWHCCHTGENSVLECTCTLEGTGYYVYCNRSDGTCIHGLHGYKTLKI
jgi:Na+-transporting NADH:ubiquinone oxidoreductase subunit E